MAISRLDRRCGSMGAMGGSGVISVCGADVELQAAEQADGGGAEKLDAGAAERHAVGFEREVGVIAVEGVGGNGDFVVDFVGRFNGGGGGVAFGQAQARAGGDVGGGVHGGDGVLAADDQAVELIEEGGGLGGFDGDADAHADVGLVAGGDREAGAQVGLVPVEFGGLAGGEEWADRGGGRVAG